MSDEKGRGFAARRDPAPRRALAPPPCRSVWAPDRGSVHRSLAQEREREGGGGGGRAAAVRCKRGRARPTKTQAGARSSPFSLLLLTRRMMNGRPYSSTASDMVQDGGGRVRAARWERKKKAVRFLQRGDDQSLNHSVDLRHQGERGGAPIQLGRPRARTPRSRQVVPRAQRVRAHRRRGACVWQQCRPCARCCWTTTTRTRTTCTSCWRL